MRLRCLAGVVLIVAATALGCARASVGPSMDELSAPELTELLQIAADSVTAVLAKDIDWLIAHARRDLRNPDTLQPLRTALESYLFGDVRRVLTAARLLEIRVRSVAADPDGTRWAQVVFFNRATITADELRHPDFLCQHDLKDAVAWTFRRVTDPWESQGFPFDAFTDIHCPPHFDARLASAHSQSRPGSRTTSHRR